MPNSFAAFITESLDIFSAISIASPIPVLNKAITVGEGEFAFILSCKAFRTPAPNAFAAAAVVPALSFNPSVTAAPTPINPSSVNAYLTAFPFSPAA